MRTALQYTQFRGRGCPALSSVTMKALVVLALLLMLPACSAAPRNLSAIHAYYQHDYTTSREQLRGETMLQRDEQTILNHARLGLAALADGELREAEYALGEVFDLLSTAGLNEDRTTAAILMHEGVRIWKGEPFEQALLYHHIATLYAVKGDWENARAAAANSLFRLTDFGIYNTPEQLARRAAHDPDFLERGYTAVDTNFALGFLMQGVASELTGAGDANGLFDAALSIDNRLDLIVERMRDRDFDTLLIVDYGKGPTKISYGPDNALVRFQPQEHHRGKLVVQADGATHVRLNPVADVDRMAVDHRWNNLEDIRRAKSIMGDVLIGGGMIATGIGIEERSLEAVLAGVGAIALGALSKSGAQADTRYLEFLPQSVYLVPLRLETTRDLLLQVEGDRGSRIKLPNVEPGMTGEPRTIYLRMHGRGSPDPAWLTAKRPIYGNDHTGVRRGDYPWILGGRDVSTPSRRVLEAYQRNGYLKDFTLEDLIALYEAEGIHIGSGMEDRPGVERNPSFRHILEGGTGLYTPERDSMGYKRLMFQKHPKYEPRSELVWNIAREIRVREREREE